MSAGGGSTIVRTTSFTTSSKIPREVFESGTSRLVGDLLDGDRASAHGGTIAIGIRHVLCTPLRLVRYVDSGEHRRTIPDVCWALLNSAEFVTRH